MSRIFAIMSGPLINGTWIVIGQQWSIYCLDTFVGRTTYCKCMNMDQLASGTWSIVQGQLYATINQNGRLDVVEGTQNQTVVVQCQFNGQTKTKSMLVSYDNQLTIEGSDTMSGSTGTMVARYNGQVVTPTWSIASGNANATIGNDGTITISQSGSIVVQAIHNGYTTTKTIQLTYVANKSSQTIVDEDGSVTTIEETTIVNQDGSTTRNSTSTTTNEDGSYSFTESQTTENQDGSSTTSSSTINQDGSSSQSQSSTTAPSQDGSTTTTTSTTYYDDSGDATGTQTGTKHVNGDGSSTSTTTNYNADGDPTTRTNEEVDVDGNAST